MNMLISGSCKFEENMMKPASNQRRENPGRWIVAVSIYVINSSVLRSRGHGSVFILMVTRSLSKIAITTLVYTHKQSSCPLWRNKNRSCWQTDTVSNCNLDESSIYCSSSQTSKFQLERDGCIFNFDYAWEFWGDLSSVIIGDGGSWEI